MRNFAVLAATFHTPISEFQTMPMWQIDELIGLAEEMNRPAK